MVDIVITPANVQKTASTKIKEGLAGVAIVAGNYVVRDPTTRRMVLADGDVVVANVQNSGMALNSAAIGQPVDYAWGGEVAVGAVLTVGGVYILSSTPGGVAPVADLASGDFTLVLGIARTTGALVLSPHTAGVAVPA